MSSNKEKYTSLVRSVGVREIYVSQVVGSDVIRASIYDADRNQTIVEFDGNIFEELRFVSSVVGSVWFFNKAHRGVQRYSFTYHIDRQ